MTTLDVISLGISGLAILVSGATVMLVRRRDAQRIPVSKIDWSNPDNAPPAFGPEQPHEYAPDESINCCKMCGGGRNHPVHHGKQFPLREGLDY